MKLQLQSTEEVFYYEGATPNTSKTISKDYTEDFDFYIQELNELKGGPYNRSQATAIMPKYQKGIWIRERPELKAELNA